MKHSWFPRAALLIALGGCVETPADETVEAQDATTADAATDGADTGATPDASEPDAAPPEADGAPACGNEDDLAPNQRPEDAEAVEAGFDRQDLFICPGRPDYFVVTLDAGEGLTIRLNADPVRIDLDLIVRDAAGATVAESANDGGSEQIDFVAAAAGDYTVEVSGFREDAAFYSLSVTSGCRHDAQCPEGEICNRAELSCEPVPAPADCGADAFEPNNRDDAAAPFQGPLAEGSLCKNDRDWFSFEAGAGDTFELLVNFPEGENVDMFVLDAQGRLISQMNSPSEVNPERLLVSHLPAGTYHVGLTAPLGDFDADREIPYTLEIVGRSGECTIDRDCENFRAPICAEGACESVAGRTAGGPGDRCSVDADCGPNAGLCYTGRPGGQDNFCTRDCSRQNECADLGLGAQCQQITREDFVCFPPCRTDDDCGIYTACTAGSCQFRGECEANEDCGADEECASIQHGQFCRVVQPAPACGLDEGLEPHGDPDEATPIELGAANEGLLICTGNADWYRFEVPADRAAALLEVGATFRPGADLDIYVTDADGQPVAQAITDQPEEVAAARFIAPGTYFARVEQVDSNRLADTEYTLAFDLIDNDERCTLEEGQCSRTEPLRAQCNEETGACEGIDGQGALALGALCDSPDDCAPSADVCWSFEGGADGYNICTIGCRGAADCQAIEGTVCTPFQGGRFSVCLPPR